MRFYTIGFAGKPAKRFFGLLEQSGVTKVVDVRLRPSGQLAGFTKKDDLKYFLARLLDCRYEHVPLLAPTQEIMESYRKGGDWDTFVEAFQSLMDGRKIPQALKPGTIADGACLLCSEEKPERCHRRLVAERLQAYYPDVEVIHLV